jgi:ectoine hydroxylase-related dioxygenase (phytanoyl-CoA dioxygenase family)
MNADQDYGFDVAGFIVVPQVLSAEQVQACNQAIDAVGRDEGMLEWPGPSGAAFRMLQEHPVLQEILAALCGPDYVLDGPPALVAAGAATAAGAPLAAGDPERNRRLRYVKHDGVRICHGVRVVWALSPSPPEQGGLIVVPASHNRRMEPPADFLSGAETLEMTEELQLQEGDLLICAATLLHGVRGRPGHLLASEYISARAMPAAGYPEIAPPQWATELRPEQQAVVGRMTSGRGGTVLSDGERAWVDTAVEQPASVAYHLDDGSMPDPHELWFWEVRGYLVLRGVMDEDWLAAANRAIDAALEAQPELPDGHPSRLEEVPEQALRENDWEWPEETSVRLRGDIHRPRMGGLYQLPRPHCEPFRKMIAHPPIVQRLNWMLGYGFRESTEPMGCVYPQGTTGGSLHGQNPGGYTAINGRPLVEQVNVAWALHDEAAGFGADSGGFLCVPGSHKASYAIPRSLTTSIDLPQVYKPPLQAGDVLMFGAVAHGTTAWRSKRQRRTVIQFMGSGNVALAPGKKSVGWRWSTDLNNPANKAAAKS